MVFKKSACIEPMYSELPFLERFHAAKNDGFEYVEFWSWTDKDLDMVKAAAEKAGIGICGFNGDAELSLIDPEQKAEYLAFLKQSVAAAKQLGASSLTIHSNGLGEWGIVVNHYANLSDTVKLCTMYGTLLDIHTEENNAVWEKTAVYFGFYGAHYTGAELKAMAEEAKRFLPGLIDTYAPRLGVHPTHVTVRNQRTRWGSCSSKGSLNFNCLLALAPEPVRRYVVIHELCHLKEMNHSPAFWRLVASQMPRLMES